MTILSRRSFLATGIGAAMIGGFIIAATTPADAFVRSFRSAPEMQPYTPQAQHGVAEQFLRTQVNFVTEEKPGTIIVDTEAKYLYFVEPGGTATRYGVGVGRDGFGWSGTVKVGRKAEWPGWTPPARMRARERAKGNILPAYVEGGPANPLGARALYLYRGGRDTIYRIHGTNQPWTIGQNMSSGCIRMMNEDVMHLYERAGVGTKVIVTRGGQGTLFNDNGPIETGLFSSNGFFGG
jgi:lipoprotein-anchoring transpeptidase ErfK/SrfK